MDNPAGHYAKCNKPERERPPPPKIKLISQKRRVAWWLPGAERKGTWHDEGQRVQIFNYKDEVSGSNIQHGDRD